MILRKLQLENIRSYESLTLSFSEGITLLCGDIGSGKSTILLAIEFALFGILRGDVDAQALLRHTQKRGHVSLTFDLESKGKSEEKTTVTVLRKLVRSKTGVTQESGELTINGTSEQLSATEIKARIFGLLAYPIEHLSKSKSLIYRYTVYTSQEQMKYILTDSSDMRLATLRTIFGIDKYKTVSENSAIALKDMRAKNQFIQGELTQFQKIADDVANIGEQLKSEQHRLEQLRTKYQELKLKTEKLKKQKDTDDLIRVQFATLTSELKQSKNNLQTLLTEKEHFETQLTAVSEKLKKIPQVSFDQKTYDDILQRKIKIEQTAHLMQQQQQDLTEQLANAKSERSLLSLKFKEAKLAQKNIAELISQKESLLSPEYISQTEQLQEQIAALRAQKELAKTRLSQLQTNSNCPLCEQEIEHNHKESLLTQSLTLSQSYESKEQDLRDKLTISKKTDAQKEQERKNVQTQQIVLAQKIEQTQSIVNTIPLLEKNLITVFDTIESLQKKLATQNTHKLTEELSQLTQQLITMQSAKNSFELIQSLKEQMKSYLETIDEKKQSIELVIQTQKELNSKLQEIDISQFEKRVEEYAHTLHEFQTIGNTVYAAQERLGFIQTQKEQLSSQFQTLTQKKKQQLQLEEQMKWISNQYIPALGVIEQSVFSSIHAEFATVFAKWFAVLLEDEAFHARLDASFTPIISQNGYEMDITHLSGGERTAIALAYRLALNHVINDVLATIQTKNLLILDEPTDGFSSEQLERVYVVLTQLKLKQIILVSHEQKLHSFANHIVSITKKDSISTIE